MKEPHPGDSISVGDHYYILASTFTADLPKLVLKHDEAFFVSDRRGDFPAVPDSEFGFYVGGTRFLDRFDLRVHGQRPLVLNAAVSDDNLQVAIDLTNADVHDGDTVLLAGRTLHFARRLTLYGRELSEALWIENFAVEAVRLDLEWRFGTDFADVFEVRGLKRERRGRLLPPVVDGATVRLSYEGLDGVVRASSLAFDPPPKEISVATAVYHLLVPPGGRLEISVAVTTMESGETAEEPLSLAEIVRRRSEEGTRRYDEATRIATAHEGLSGWLRRSRGDLHMLVTETPAGSIPYAGIPWYVAPFGRDSLITALQMLPFEPQIARGTLRFLARHQGIHDDPFTDQEPGRILHELRQGEMAACREIPFIPYYGSVDATPLFVILLGEYLRWTGDRFLAEELWPNLELALRWILGTGHGEGYLAYTRRSSVGLGNQGWKDSHDAIMHASGELASTPIALVEAQGYKYAALLSAAEIADTLSRGDGGGLRDAARRLRDRFETDFWQASDGFYALALDGSGRPCRVMTSNPGHCLWSGIADERRAEAVAARLLAEDMFSGWGLRTLSTRERLYNPMSYHNGSVWPHDTAIAAAGLRRYGQTEAFLSLATALFDAALEWEGARMPELFCGFTRSSGLGPTRYPVACSPQAWAAGVPFHLLSAMLGLSPDARENRLSLIHPVLPAWLDWVEIRDLRLGSSSLDFVVSRGSQTAAVELLSRRGDAELIVRP
ncbi:MAG TPA: amylo-alpha-1,6-glucosidase [Candidatus Eisenbacteria bacterium]|nr:amylo-alpha-1,6-glucosidase [Candidatus Eisenbacteria bacterium]